MPERVADDIEPSPRWQLRILWALFALACMGLLYVTIQYLNIREGSVVARVQQFESKLAALEGGLTTVRAEIEALKLAKERSDADLRHVLRELERTHDVIVEAITEARRRR